MLVDSHCHLVMLDKDKQGSTEDVLKRANENDVNLFLNVSVDLETFPEVLAIAKTHNNVYASVGVHPNAQNVEDPSVEKLIELASDPKVIAIGETGLDYYRSEGDLSWQHDRFRRHIQAAKAVKKPLIIHTREARDDTIRILKEESANEIGGIFHCFTESWEMAEQGLALGFYISFSGIVTFKNAKELQEVAKKVPSDRYLIETDCPYLAPVPFRGKLNEPGYVRYVAEFIAELREADFTTIASESTENFMALFGPLINS